jgi:hypothetical protein
LAWAINPVGVYSKGGAADTAVVVFVVLPPSSSVDGPKGNLGTLKFSNGFGNSGKLKSRNAVVVVNDDAEPPDEEDIGVVLVMAMALEGADATSGTLLWRCNETIGNGDGDAPINEAR